MSDQSDQQACYGECRKNMCDGDVLLFKGKGWLSSIIKWKTASEYSHAGIVAWWHDRLMVLEAVGSGVRATPISYNLRKYPGGIDYYCCADTLTAEQRQSMIDFAQKQLGKKYDVFRLLQFFIKLVFGMPLERGESDRVPSTFFCSEYVAEVYEQVECDLVLERSNQYTSPDLLAASEKLKFVGCLK